MNDTEWRVESFLSKFRFKQSWSAHVVSCTFLVLPIKMRKGIFTETSCIFVNAGAIVEHFKLRLSIPVLNFAFGWHPTDLSHHLDKELHRMHVRPKPPSDHPPHGGPAQSAPRGYCQDLSQRKWLRCVREV